MENWNVKRFMHSCLGQEKSDKMLRQMLSSILEAAGSDQQSPLTTIISQYLEKNKPDKPVSREQQASLDLDLMKSHGKVSPENFISCECLRIFSCTFHFAHNIIINSLTMPYLSGLLASDLVHSIILNVNMSPKRALC